MIGKENAALMIESVYRLLAPGGVAYLCGDEGLQAIPRVAEFLKGKEREFKLLTSNALIISKPDETSASSDQTKAPERAMAATGEEALAALEKRSEFKGRVSQKTPDFSRMVKLGEGGAAFIYQDPWDPEVFYKVTRPETYEVS